MQTTTIEAFAPAKVNLTLHVTGQRADGYHTLDSLVMFADERDRLWLTSADDMSMQVLGPFRDGVPADSRNLAWRAAELAGWRGHIRLEKNLPHGAGIGGGSSDAAAVLNALGYRGNGLELGADVPVCRGGALARMGGIGEDIERVNAGLRLYAVLVNPRVPALTGVVFKALTHKDNPPMGTIPNLSGFSNWCDWLEDQRNDLQDAAASVAPEIAEALDALRNCQGARVVRMSGSGATCFALFPSEAHVQTAASLIETAYPHWWVQEVVLS